MSKPNAVCWNEYLSAISLKEMLFYILYFSEYLATISRVILSFFRRKSKEVVVISSNLKFREKKAQ